MTPILINIQLTHQQLSIIQQALDAVVKGGGIQHAKVVLPLYNSIEEQIKQQIAEQPIVTP